MMKTTINFKAKRYIFFGLSILLIGVSCTKDVMVPAVDFDVLVENHTVPVGEPVEFKFTGTADLITFYSGESGHEYEYRDRVVADGQPMMEFISFQQNAHSTPTLQLLVSKDFNGVYEAESIRAATWTDITSRATLSTGSTDVLSGAIDLSEFKSGGDSDETVESDPDAVPGIDPVFVAFRYLADISDEVQPTWTISDLFVRNWLADGSVVSVASLDNLSWGAVNIAGSQTWTYNASRLQMSGGTPGSDPNEDWIITQPLQTDRVERARGISVKGNPIATQYDYQYTFETPGIYTVTFEALNVSRWDKKSKVIEITITVQ